MLSKKRDAAARARSQEGVEAILEHETDCETLELLASSGVTLRVLVSTAVSEHPLEAFDTRDVGPDWNPDPDFLAKAVRRIELRLGHQLPHRECIVDEADREPEASSCTCLSETLDDAETLTRAGVVRKAKKTHAKRWAWTKNKPPPRPEPVSRPERVPPKPRPIPPKIVSETPTRKDIKVVKRRRKWFDESTDIRDMRF
jgi:hypothetical protein